MAQVVDVLNDPSYWVSQEDRSWHGTLISFFASIIVVALSAVVIVGITMLVQEAEHSQDHDARMEQQCLDKGGQWVKRDCVVTNVNFDPLERLNVATAECSALMPYGDPYGWPPNDKKFRQCVLDHEGQTVP